MVSLLFPFTVNALSATTANMIAGTAPYLVLLDGAADEHGNPTQGTKLTDLNELLGFTMPNGSGGKIQFNASQANATLTTAIKAPEKMKFKDVVALIKATSIATPIPASMQKDDDGDAGVPEGNMTVTWYNGDIKPANIVTDLDQTLPVCGGPYHLVISVDAVKAKTTYGYPDREKIYSTGTTSATYKFVGQDMGICYLRTAEYAQFYTGTATGANPTIKYANGYNPDVWVKEGSTHKGFKRNAGFPTTGFDKAKFSLIGSGTDQSDYTCERESGGTWVTYSTASASPTLGKGCEITYNTVTRPTTPVTIKMSYKGTKIDSYTLDYTNTAMTKWALLQSTTYRYGDQMYLNTSTIFPALNQCRTVVDGSASPLTTKEQVLDMTDDGKKWRQKYLYRRNELTNSPFADPDKYKENTSPAVGGNYSRDVDGTFMGEWGYVFSGYGTPPSGSGWGIQMVYWTSEAFSTTHQFSIWAYGAVGRTTPDLGSGNGYVLVCRG